MPTMSCSLQSPSMDVTGLLVQQNACTSSSRLTEPRSTMKHGSVASKVCLSSQGSHGHVLNIYFVNLVVVALTVLASNAFGLFHLELEICSSFPAT